MSTACGQSYTFNKPSFLTATSSYRDKEALRLCVSILDMGAPVANSCTAPVNRSRLGLPSASRRPLHLPQTQYRTSTFNPCNIINREDGRQ